MVVQLIQNLVWILLSGESMDPVKHLNGFEWSYRLLLTLFKWYHHVCTKPMGILKVEIVNGFKSVGGLIIYFFIILHSFSR